MGIKILAIRHQTTPPVGGCRWCGFGTPDHGNAWIPGRGWHTFADPTDDQRKARLKAGSTTSLSVPLRTPGIVTNVASDARTRL
jgi:hypothetical protein